MKLYTACVIGCIGLFLAGTACLFMGVNPGILREPTHPDGGAVEDRIPPSPPEARDEPCEEKKPGVENEARGLSPSR